MRTAEFISSEDPRWEKFLRTCRHDFYHLPEYAKLCAKYEGATPAAFYAEDGHTAFLAPLMIRPIPRNLGAPEGWSDAVSPYGYSTPLVTPPQASLEASLEAFCLAARQRSLVTAFFRLHPLLVLNHEGLGRIGNVVKHGQTVFIDLTESSEAIWAQTHGWHRREIQRLVRLGFTVSLDDWKRFEDFFTIYHETMQRVKAKEMYLFPREYFEDLRAALGERLHLCCVLSPENEVATACLFVEMLGIVQIHLMGTARKFLRLAPSKLATDFIRRWAQERSNEVLHLGGGVGSSSDSLFEHKAGFAKGRSDFYSYRIVFDAEKYDQLIPLASAIGQETRSTDSDFFPAYRTFVRLPERLRSYDQRDRDELTTQMVAWHEAAINSPGEAVES